MREITSLEDISFKEDYAPEFNDTALELPMQVANSDYFEWFLAEYRNESFVNDLLLTHRVIQSGVHNRYGCRIPLDTCWNLPLFSSLLNDYHDQDLIEWMTYGFPISRSETTGDPTPSDMNHMGANKYPQQVDEYFLKEVQMGSTMGPFKIPPFLNRIGISPISTRQKKDSMDRRVILDLSWPRGESVNDGIPKDQYCGESISLKYPTVDTLTKRVYDLGKNCLLWKKDLKRAFRLIYLCPMEYSMIGMRWRNLFFFDKVMPMGLRSAAYVCQRITNAISFIHRNMGYWSINYLDDFGSAEPAEIAWNSYHAMGKILCSIGAKEAEQKSFPPCTRIEFLGNIVDSEKMTLEVTADRKTQLTEELKLWRSRKTATKRQMQSLIGKLSFITNCVRSGRIFLSRIIDNIRGLNRPKDRLIITSEFKDDVKWWLKFLPQFNGILLLWLHDTDVSVYLEIDASLAGGGALCPVNRQFCRFKFDEFILNMTEHISQLEIFTLCVAVKIWARMFHGKLIRIKTDNQATMYALNKGRTKDHFMLMCLHEIAWVTAKHCFMIKAEFVASVDNILPDILSRWTIENKAKQKFRRLTANKGYKRIIVRDEYTNFNSFW